MITSNSTRHRGARLDYIRPSPLSSIARALRRAVLLRWYRWQLRCIAEERQGYEAAGVMLGVEYLKNCEIQTRVLRGRIAFLECDL